MKDNLGDRMKSYYENRSKTFLTRRTPVIIRLDGKAFHTFTKGFNKPFDFDLIWCMQDTMKYLCKNIQGCVLGYTQSDEITLVLIDYQNLNTDAWFDYNVQKICSVSASMTTWIFNKILNEHLIGKCETNSEKNKASEMGALFDSRCFNIPVEEVTNCLLWRQQDAIRNSIQAVGQSVFSHKELQNLSCDKIKEKLYESQNINWDSFPTYLKRGSCCIKIDGNWTIDNNIPEFINEGRNYIENLIMV